MHDRSVSRVNPHFLSLYLRLSPTHLYTGHASVNVGVVEDIFDSCKCRYCQGLSISNGEGIYSSSVFQWKSDRMGCPSSYRATSM